MLLLVIVWKILYVYIIAPSTSINPWLTSLVGDTATKLPIGESVDSSFDGRYFFINSKKAVIVDHSCNGLEIHAMFIGLILLAPGNLLIKLVFSFFAHILIFLANSIRVLLLGNNAIFSPSTFDFNHKYLYLSIVYLMIFLLWLLWVEVLSKIRIKPLN